MSRTTVILPPSDSELALLVDSICEGTITPAERDRLEAILAEDQDAKLYYVAYMDLHAQVQWLTRGEGTGAGRTDVASSIDTSVDPSFGVDLEPEITNQSFPSLSITHYPPSTNFVGGPVFSYMVATLVLCAMLLSAWAYKITHDADHIVGPPQSPNYIHDSEYVFVGQVTDMRDCTWKDNNTATIIGASVPLGRKYSLSAGLMEITYQSGAVVILEGPCYYEVDSRAGGYLSLGKLTAKVEKERLEVKAQSSGLKAQSSALFSVTTPTAIVTDLGTEFGVEVDEKGNTASHVFSGSVKVQLLDDDNSQSIVLRENESASVQCGADGKVVVVRNKSFVPGTFVCRMLQWTPFEVFSTGLGLKEGETDTHWQIVARSDQPEFKPHSAVVTSISMEFSDIFRPNDASQSQWISTGGEMPTLTEGITFSFRTTFKLSDLPASTAKSVSLRGGFIADNHVTAIRLNGKEVSVPEHGYQAPFNYLFRFAVRDGFVEGTNVLEFDVLNEAPGERMLPVSPMALRVELDGRILRGGRTASADSSKTNKTKAGKGERK